MKKMKYIIILGIFVGLAVLISGCGGPQPIAVEYMPESEAQNWFADASGNPPATQPTIAVNPFWDDRQQTDRIGESGSWFGKSAWDSEESPTAIIEAALVSQLEKAGFKVIKTSGWNLTPETIPDVEADLILSGKVKAFWVESHPGAWNGSIDSNVQFDLIIADVKSKKIIWSGQFSGEQSNSAFSYWNTKQNVINSINASLTQAIDKVFQEEQPKNAILTLFKAKF